LSHRFNQTISTVGLNVSKYYIFSLLSAWFSFCILIVVHKNRTWSIRMNNRVLKNIIFLLTIVLFILSLSACKTMKAAVSFKWGKRTECERHLEAKKVQIKYPSTSNEDPWLMSKQ